MHPIVIAILAGAVAFVLTLSRGITPWIIALGAIAIMWWMRP